MVSPTVGREEVHSRPQPPPAQPPAAQGAGTLDRGAARAGAAVAVLLSAAIYLGSRRLVDFDATLVATA